MHRPETALPSRDGVAKQGNRVTEIAVSPAASAGTRRVPRGTGGAPHGLPVGYSESLSRQSQTGSLTLSSTAQQPHGPIYGAEIHGVVTSVTIEYLRRALQLAEAANANQSLQSALGVLRGDSRSIVTTVTSCCYIIPSCFPTILSRCPHQPARPC